LVQHVSQAGGRLSSIVVVAVVVIFICTSYSEKDRQRVVNMTHTCIAGELRAAVLGDVHAKDIRFRGPGQT